MEMENLASIVSNVLYTGCISKKKLKIVKKSYPASYEIIAKYIEARSVLIMLEKAFN